MNIREFVKSAKIDYANSFILIDDLLYLDYTTRILPKTYLEFAKKDLTDEYPRGKINAITNSKRAIDCMLSNVILWLGYGTEEYTNSALQEYLNQISPSSDLSFPLKIFQAFDLSPTRLIAKARKVRNTIEHDFIEPTDDEALESVEVAELFIRSVENKIQNATSVEITDQQHRDAMSQEYISGIQISFRDKSARLWFERKN